MKRLPIILLLAVPAMLAAQEAPKEPTATERAAERPSQGEHGEMEIWKLANFVILVAGLGYLVKKNAGPFFAARNKKIAQDMLDAKAARADAERRAADVDRRLANLENEIAALRAESQNEGKAETERSMKHTASEIAKIQAHAEQEIASAGKAARMDLKRYSAELAVQMAEQKIAARMTGDAQDNLVRGFVHDLQHPTS